MFPTLLYPKSAICRMKIFEKNEEKYFEKGPSTLAIGGVGLTGRARSRNPARISFPNVFVPISPTKMSQCSKLKENVPWIPTIYLGALTARNLRVPKICEALRQIF